MRRTMVMMAMAAMALGAPAATAKPGPNGSNNYGLCNAYFKGSENGRANKRKAPPFAELERVSSEAYDEEFGENEASVEDKVAWWCSANAPHPSSNGGGKASGDTTSSGKGKAASSGKGRR